MKSRTRRQVTELQQTVLEVLSSLDSTVWHQLPAIVRAANAALNPSESLGRTSVKMALEHLKEDGLANSNIINGTYCWLATDEGIRFVREASK